MAYNSINTVINPGRDGLALIFKLLQFLSREDTALACGVMWAKSLLFDWKAARKVSQATNTLSSDIRNVKWTKPLAGRFKCNIDVSFSNHNNRIGLGMFIKKHQMKDTSNLLVF
jgi:hypothetical protein